MWNNQNKTKINQKQNKKQKLFHSLIIVFFRFDLWFPSPTDIGFSLCDLILGGYHLQFLEFQLMMSTFMCGYTRWTFEKVRVIPSTIGTCAKESL